MNWRRYIQSWMMAGLWSLRGLSWRELAKRTSRESWRDEVFGQSARLAFYFFFTLCPVLLLFLIFLGQSAGAGSQLRGTLLDSLRQVLPPDASALIARTIQQLNVSAILGSGAILPGLGAAWGALNGTWAIITGLNKAYGIEEGRRWWRLLLALCGLTISLGFLGAVALAAILYGDKAGNIIGGRFGAPDHADLLWRIIQWIVILILLLFSSAVLYRFGPNLKDRRWQWSIPGAIVAVALWIPSTLLLRVYVEHFSSSQRIFGGLSAVATLLMWLYLTGAAIFIGGEMNSEIQKAAAEAGQADVKELAEPAEQRSDE